MSVVGVVGSGGWWVVEWLVSGWVGVVVGGWWVVGWLVGGWWVSGR